MSPVEFHNSQYLADLKETMLRGEIDETCISCKMREDAGLQSIRKHFLSMFGNSTFESLDYMELRASNLCNFECIMCNADSSSLIAKEVYTVSNENWDQLIKIAENLKALNLTGGEPMITKHFYMLLDHLINVGKTDMRLSVYTNASVYNPIFVEKMLKFRTHLHLSIDGIGPTAERQRKGSNWNEVSKNITKFLELPVKLTFHSTFTTESLKDVASLAKYFVNILKLNPECNFNAHTVTVPKDLSVFRAKDEDKQIMIKSISDALEMLTDAQFSQLKNQLSSYKKMLEK